VNRLLHRTNRASAIREMIPITHEADVQMGESNSRFRPGADYCSAQIERQLTGRNRGIAEFLEFFWVVLTASHKPDGHIQRLTSRSLPKADLHQTLINPVRANYDGVGERVFSTCHATFLLRCRLYPIPARPRLISKRVVGSGTVTPNRVMG